LVAIVQSARAAHQQFVAQKIAQSFLGGLKPVVALYFSGDPFPGFGHILCDVSDAMLAISKHSAAFSRHWSAVNRLIGSTICGVQYAVGIYRRSE
jgi:hypothetical protein